MKGFGHLVVSWAQADAIFNDITAIGHERPVSDVMRIELDLSSLNRPTTNAAFVAIPFKDSVTELLPDALFVARHGDLYMMR